MKLPLRTKVSRWLVWNILSKLFILLHIRPNYPFRRTRRSQPLPKAPYMVVANHGTFFDPWLVGGYSNDPFAIMCNDDAFKGSKVAKWYLENVGAFAKKKGASDFRSMRTALSRMNQGYPVLIFPEGQTTWDGETQLIYKGLEKIVKRSRAPLVAVRLQGNFLTRPWWAETIRKGLIRITFQIVPAEEIARMSDEELLEKIKELIYQNDVKDPENRKITFKGQRLAEGLERFFWMCHSCGGEDTLTTSGDRITCESCGSHWDLDAWGGLRPVSEGIEDIKDWSTFHRAKTLQKVKAAGKNAILTENRHVAFLKQNDNGEFDQQGTGELRLTTSELTFTCDDDTLKIPVEEITNFVVQKKDIFECTYRNTDYRFVFAGKSPMKWVMYLQYLRGWEEQEAQGYIA